MAFELNDFQKKSIRFLIDRLGESSIIRGGTGKGKTVTVLGLSSLLKRKGLKHRILVVCPKTAVASFERDLHKFNQDFGLKGLCIHSPKDMSLWLQKRPSDRNVIDVVVIALHVIAELPDLCLDTFIGFGHLVIDEIHELRNYTSKKYRNTMYLKIRHSLNVIGLTATLFYTRLEDIFFIMQFIKPELFPCLDTFRARYLKFIEKDICIQRRSWGDIGSFNEDARSTINSFDGYKENAYEVWELVKPYMYEDVDSSKFKIEYKFIPYNLNSLQEFKTKLRGEGIYSVLHITIRSSNGLRVRDLTKKPSDLIPTFESGIKVDKRVDTLKVGDVVYSSTGENFLIENICKEDDDTRLAQVIIPVVQKYLSKSAEKYEKLLELITDKGSLIFCEYIPSAHMLREKISKDLYNTGRKVILLDGSVKNKKQALANIDWDLDIVIVTKSASQSMDYYFDQVILYEPISHPGKFVQLQGRIMRADTVHRNLFVYLLCCFDTLEEYFYHRVCLLIKQSGSYNIKLPVETGFDSIDDLKKVKLWGLLKD